MEMWRDRSQKTRSHGNGRAFQGRKRKKKRGRLINRGARVINRDTGGKDEKERRKTKRYEEKEAYE